MINNRAFVIVIRGEKNALILPASKIFTFVSSGNVAPAAL
jgi:hypothetical protein